MKIKCLFGRRLDGEDEIELMTAWDEYCIDANPEGFEEACADAKRSWGKDLEATRMVEIEVDFKRLRSFFDDEELDAKMRLSE